MTLYENHTLISSFHQPSTLLSVRLQRPIWHSVPCSFISQRPYHFRITHLIASVVLQKSQNTSDYKGAFENLLALAGLGSGM
jgi:hypothetical protein